MADYRENMKKCQEYISALEEERRKILVFQRELPLCLELVTQALVACKQQLPAVTTVCLNEQSECSEQTTSDGPILEEFIPIKRSSLTDEDDELESHKPKIAKTQNNDKSGKKSDWLRSVQLWNQPPDPPSKEDTQPKKVSVVEVKKTGGAFHPFQKETNDVNKATSAAAAAPVASACSTVEIAVARAGDSGGSKKEEKDGQSQRKARRCWSPELHKRFLNALQHLGGSHVATPKQIREHMKVDGLTNDEVKSHLQKYRLHTRRPTPAKHSNDNTSQTPQFVVVGGIWVPPPSDYSAAAAGTTNLGEASLAAAPARIYAPVAAPPPPPQEWQQQKQLNQSNCEQRGSQSDGGVQSNSPASSSSTHGSMASPAP
ncbi:hypothetical protein Nepgr_003704 [Nepenthes gracilis]|uniref:HTH myb-type domain-containing protein n=1 Tax=Nepenthes gracilis TaxID=150966 RepID=A0AAD3S012_NEPGR|nr:hypothetical protein Nepgr_003704 [Nepenthes gracilis]